MNTHRPFKILFLCTGNSARSIFGEYLIRRIGGGRFESFSAGSDPRGEVNPYALRVLSELFGIDASDARSKSWSEFAEGGFDFVITVCDDARETCPHFSGQPVLAHWSSPDPAAFVGDETATFGQFARVAFQIQRRVELLCGLPIEKLDRLRVEQLTREIGQQAALEQQDPTRTNPNKP